MEIISWVIFITIIFLCVWFFIWQVIIMFRNPPKYDTDDDEINLGMIPGTDLYRYDD